MEDSKPTPVAGQIEQLTAKVIARVTRGLSAAIAAALQEAGLADRVETLTERLESLAPGSGPTGTGPDAPAEPSREDDQADGRTCSEPDCDLPSRARGLCSKHYQRLRYAEKRAVEAGETLPKSLAEARSRRGRKPARKTAKRGGTTCSVEDCQRPTYAKGMCGKHFMEWVRAQKDLKALQEGTEPDPD